MFYCFLATGFEEIEALTPVDMFRRASLDVKTVGMNGKIVSGSHKIPVICDDSRIVWVPGLGVRDDSGVGEKMTISFCTTEGGGEELYAALKEK